MPDAAPKCESCGYLLAGVPIDEGVLTCPECGTTQVPGRDEPLWSRWVFVLGAASPNYVMLCASFVSWLMGEIGMAAGLSIFVLGLTLGVALGFRKDLARPGDGLWVCLGRAGVWWAVLNAPVAGALWAMWP